MKINGSYITDLALGAPRDLAPSDYSIDLPPDLAAVIPLIQPMTVSAIGTNETVQGSFFKANHSLTLAPATGQTITDFVTLVAGLWRITVMVEAWFDYAFAVGNAKSFALGLLPTDTGQTTQILAIFAAIGTQNRQVTMDLLLRKGGTLRSVLGPTAALQNIAVSVSMIGNRIL